jgi:hypothetical protein
MRSCRLLLGALLVAAGAAAGAARAGDARSAEKILADLAKRAEQITYAYEDDETGEMVTATEELSFKLLDGGSTLAITEKISDDSGYENQHTFAIPLGAVAIKPAKTSPGMSVRTRSKLGGVSISCDGRETCIRMTFDLEPPLFSKQTGRVFHCEPKTCVAIEQDLKQLVALARGQSEASAVEAALPSTPDGLVERLNGLLTELELAAMVSRDGDTAHLSTTIDYAATLDARKGLLRVLGSGGIDAQYEKSGKQTHETIGDDASIPLHGVSVQLGTKVVGRRLADGADVHFVTLACELEKGCIKVAKQGRDGVPQPLNSYSMLCAADDCVALEPVLQKLVAAVRIEWAEKSDADAAPRKANKR